MSQINLEKWSPHRHVANYNYYMRLSALPSQPGFSSGLLVKVIDTGFQDCFVDSAFSLIRNHILKLFLTTIALILFWTHCLALMHTCTCLVTQVCLTVCDPVDCSLPVSSVHGILQERILKWVAYPFYKGSSQLRDQTWVSCITGRFLTIWATREALVPQFKIQYLSFYRHHKYLFIITKYKSIKLRKHIWFWHFNLNTTSFLFLLHLSKWDTFPKTKCSKMSL